MKKWIFLSAGPPSAPISLFIGTTDLYWTLCIRSNNCCWCSGVGIVDMRFDQICEADWLFCNTRAKQFGTSLIEAVVCLNVQANSFWSEIQAACCTRSCNNPKARNCISEATTGQDTPFVLCSLKMASCWAGSNVLKGSQRATLLRMSQPWVAGSAETRVDVNLRFGSHLQVSPWSIHESSIG